MTKLSWKCCQKEILEYKNGKLTSYKKYVDDELVMCAQYLDGVKHGKWLKVDGYKQAVAWYDNGVFTNFVKILGHVIIREKIFENGKLLTYNAKYDTGEPLMEATYIDGSLIKRTMYYSQPLFK